MDFEKRKERFESLVSVIEQLVIVTKEMANDLKIEEDSKTKVPEKFLEAIKNMERKCEFENVGLMNLELKDELKPKDRSIKDFTHQPKNRIV